MKWQTELDFLKEIQSQFWSKRSQWRASMAILGATVLILVWKYFGTQPFFLAHVASSDWTDTTRQTLAELYRFGSFALSMGLLPAMVVRFGLREKFADYGVSCGGTEEQRRWVWCLIGIGLPLFAIMGAMSATEPSFRVEFPFNKHAADSLTLFAIHVGGYLVYYVAWEFFFRGFLQTLLREQTGIATAILIQTAFATLLHIGGPAMEVFSCIPGSLFWGIVAWKTRSILPSLTMHAAMGIALDAAIVYGW
ncbi:MAG: type II CAAX endopeptidase family protein [Thermoguttaceae bacterium]|nr:type II CAAX endopeptidase family protein [Thermoguttaceae bacterium]